MPNNMVLAKEEASKEMSCLIGAMAHRWKQPINVLSLLIQDVRDAYEYKELDKEYLDDFVFKSMVNVDSLVTSIDEFRNFFKPRFKKDDFDIEKNFNEIINMLSYQYSTHNIKFKINLLPQSFKINAFTNSFKQAIMNIFYAIKETYDNNEKIDIKHKKIDINIYPKKKIIKICEYSSSFDEYSLKKLFSDKKINMLECINLASIYNAKEFLRDGANAKLTYEAVDGNIVFVIKF